MLTWDSRFRFAAAQTDLTANQPGAITDGVCAMFSGLACVAANNPGLFFIVPVSNITRASLSGRDKNAIVQPTIQDRERRASR
eukprot:755290-Hanusia_phi.AAC.2